MVMPFREIHVCDSAASLHSIRLLGVEARVTTFLENYDSRVLNTSSNNAIFPGKH
jgi:hypothetical protein